MQGLEKKGRCKDGANDGVKYVKFIKDYQVIVKSVKTADVILNTRK